MSKLFKCKISWYNNDNNPFFETEEITLMADNYIMATEQLVNRYQDKLIGYSIYEIENTWPTKDSCVDNSINSGTGFSSFDIQIQGDE
jgi:hypothetical protein